MLDLSKETAVARNIAKGRSASILHEIHRSGCAAAVWQRNLPPVFSAWLAALPQGRLPALREIVDLGEVATKVRSVCAKDGDSSVGLDLLAQDVSALARHFSEITGQELMHLRLDVVRGNACHRFHTDYVPLRMLCTYRGSGTQFGPAGEDGNPSTVDQMRAGDVGLFRGRLWPGDVPCGLLHRSPPIEGTGEIRLLLAIDPPREDD
ncbi:DUF1826 domain-containing protein [Halovulum sp. GXIMD14794]